MRPKRDWRSNSPECYKLFKVAHPEININSIIFAKIVKGYNEALIEYALETGNMVFLPHRFGIVYINRNPTPNFVKCRDGVTRNIMAVDWPKSKELGKKVYIQNLHTDGFRYSFMWRSNKSMFIHDCWKFRVTRIGSRLLAKNLKENYQKYRNIYHDWKFAPNTKKNPNA